MHQMAKKSLNVAQKQWQNYKRHRGRNRKGDKDDKKVWSDIRARNDETEESSPAWNRDDQGKL